ncbi:MAG: Ig-like domain-containing protein, partial [Chloroflexota bacterium]
FQGLGFSFQGLGFSFQGLGFSFQGLGFSFQGLGLDDPRLEDPALFAEEILANPVPTDWLGAQLEEIVNGAEFGSSRSAILIIDDSDHGSNVQSVIEYMASVPGVQALLDSGQLYVELLDISRVNYTGDEIAAAIGERVEALQNDYENIVLNFSITFIPCEADFDEDGEPDFVFSEFIDVVAEEAEEEGGEEEELLPIVPTIDCAVLQEIGESAYQLNVVFGYDNPNSETVYLEERFEGLEQNFVSTNVSSEGEPFIFFTAETVPEYFVPGTYEEVFEGIIGAFASEGDSFTVEWTLLDTTVGITIEVGEGYEGPTCTVGPGGELDLSPEDEVVPFLQCVEVFEGDDTFVTATFGYENIGDTTVWLPRGDNGIQVNEAFFEGGDPQPHFFVPGRHRNVWQVSFGGEGSVEWTTGQDFSDFETGYSNSASADINSPECTDEFEIGNYLFEIGLTTSEEIRDALETLFNYDDADDDLDALKSLLQGYLAFSAEDNNQSVFAVASAGNYRPWLGDAPLVPARWDETIAVSASLGLLPEKWIFSQQGDFIAPGGGYFIPNGFDPTGQEIPLVGTSYSAPVVSLIGALWGQYPAACAFPENNNTFFPPIEDFDADDVSFDATDELASPYRCSTEGFPDENRAPIAVDDTAEVDAGASVIIDVLGNDSDPDGDTLSVTNVGTLPMHGTATVNADGTITYQNAGTGTSDNFTYVVSDGELTDTATV